MNYDFVMKADAPRSNNRYFKFDIPIRKVAQCLLELPCFVRFEIKDRGYNYEVKDLSKIEFLAITECIISKF